MYMTYFPNLHDEYLSQALLIPACSVFGCEYLVHVHTKIVFPRPGLD